MVQPRGDTTTRYYCRYADAAVHTKCFRDSTFPLILPCILQTVVSSYPYYCCSIFLVRAYEECTRAHEYGQHSTSAKTQNVLRTGIHRHCCCAMYECYECYQVFHRSNFFTSKVWVCMGVSGVPFQSSVSVLKAVRIYLGTCLLYTSDAADE